MTPRVNHTPTEASGEVRMSMPQAASLYRLTRYRAGWTPDDASEREAFLAQCQAELPVLDGLMDAPTFDGFLKWNRIQVFEEEERGA